MVFNYLVNSSSIMHTFLANLMSRVIQNMSKIVSKVKVNSTKEVQLYLVQQLYNNTKFKPQNYYFNYSPMQVHDYNNKEIWTLTLSRGRLGQCSAPQNIQLNTQECRFYFHIYTNQPT